MFRPDRDIDSGCATLIKNNDVIKIGYEKETLGYCYVPITMDPCINVNVPMKFGDVVKTHPFLNFSILDINPEVEVYLEVTRFDRQSASLMRVDLYPNKVDTNSYLLKDKTLYTMTIKDNDVVLLENNVNLKNLLTVDSDTTLINHVNTFFSNPPKGRRNKMGILLYGPPGNGKSTAIMKLVQSVDAVGITIPRQLAVDGYYMAALKTIMSGRKVVFIIEELTERMNQLEPILTFLDGEASWDNCVTIATTNYPEELPHNLVDRPGRFDTIIMYKNPTDERIAQLANLFDVTDFDCLFNKGLSYDYVSFILSRAKELGVSVAETLKLEQDKRSRLSETFKGKLGL